MALVTIGRDIYVAPSGTVNSAPVALAGANGVHLSVTAISLLGQATPVPTADNVEVIPQISVDGVSWRGFGTALAAKIIEFAAGTPGSTQYGLGAAQETIAANAPSPKGTSIVDFRVSLGAVYFRVQLKASATGGGVFSVDVNTFVA